MRTCPACGLSEQRTRDEKGRESVNLDPVTGKCIACLVKTVTLRGWPANDKPFDPRAAAARNDE